MTTEAEVSTVVDALNVLGQHDGATPLAQVAPQHAPFWKGIVLAGLAALRAFVHLDGDQSTAWDTVTAIIAGL